VSFDIWFQRFKLGQPAPLLVSVVDALFEPFVIHDGGSFVRVRFPDGSGADIWGKQRPAGSGLTFNHCGGAQFSDAFFELLKRTDSVIFWPCGGCVVADPSVVPDLPPHLVETFGTPKVVKSGADIFECITKS
jgi:hypothetical protein